MASIHKSDPFHRIGGFQRFGHARVLHKGGEDFFDAPVCGGLDFQKMREQGLRYSTLLDKMIAYYGRKFTYLLRKSLQAEKVKAEMITQEEVEAIFQTSFPIYDAEVASTDP